MGDVSIFTTNTFNPGTDCTDKVDVAYLHYLPKYRNTG